MIYLYLKALHVAAAMIWISGLLMMVVTLNAQVTSGVFAQDQLLLMEVRRWDRLVTSPSMLLVWGLGLTLIMQGEWFIATWLMIKIALVLALSAIHGMLSGKLKRLVISGESKLQKPAMAVPIVVIVCFLVIVFMAVVKPL